MYSWPGGEVSGLGEFKVGGSKLSNLIFAPKLSAETFGGVSAMGFCRKFRQVISCRIVSVGESVPILC